MSMFKLPIIALSCLAVASCGAETTYIDPEDVGKAALPLYFSQPITQESTLSLNCLLREFSLENSSNTFEHSSAQDGWVIDIIYGYRGPSGGRHIGQVKRNETSIAFFYQPSLANFGMDAWNVETSVPKAIRRCA